MISIPVELLEFEILICSEGKELTSSDNNFAGTATDPPSSICAPTQVLIAISRFVVTSLIFPLSVVINTFCVTGRVVRDGTALLTILRPLFKFS